MADKAISELTAATAVTPSDMFVLEQNGTAKKLTGQVLENWLVSFADGHGGIHSIVKTGTSGLVDTYTITYADTSTSTFTVTNGAKGDTGDVVYTWIKYAAVQPTVSSQMKNTADKWMGIYTGFAKEAPSDVSLYTWYEIKGEKGDIGVASSITAKEVSYQAWSSGTIVPTGQWQSSIPVVVQGQYLWTKTSVTFNDGSEIISYSVGRMGTDGTGTGTVTAVNSVEPNNDGNVTLAPEDIGAVASVNNTFPGANGNVALTADKVGALPAAGGTVSGALTLNGMLFLNSNIFGTKLPAAGNANRVFFVEVS